MEPMDRVTELSILYEISNLPTRLKDRRAIARLAVNKATRLLGSDVAVFYLYRETLGVLHPLAARGIRVSRLGDLPVPTVDPAIAQALVERKPLSWHAGEEGGDAVPNLLGKRYAVQSVVCVPVRAEDKVWGLIYAVRLKARPYTESEHALFGVLADRVAQALENMASFQTLERRVNELQTLNQIGQVLSQILSLDVMLENLHQQVSQVLDANSFFIILSDPHADEWVSVYHIERGERQTTLRSARGKGLTGYILRTGEPVLLRTEEENTTFLKSQGIDLVGEQAQSWLGVPLKTGGEVIGVLGVQSYARPYLYDEYDLSLLSTIATQAAVAINNARLFQDVERARREQQALTEHLEMLHQVTLALAEEQLDLDAMMDILTHRAMEYLVCDGAGCGCGMRITRSWNWSPRFSSTVRAW